MTVVYTPVRGRSGGILDLLRKLKVGGKIVVATTQSGAACPAWKAGQETGAHYTTKKCEDGYIIRRVS